jgi:two-component system response regulator
MLRIALVEDNPADAQLLQSALQKSGLPVEVVLLQDGVQAVEYVSGAPGACDLIMLDLNLPRLSGFEVLERLRCDDQFKSIPILVVSGSSDPADVERCYRAGANSYICKPIHLDDIFVMAKQLVTYWSVHVKLPSRRASAPERLERSPARVAS